MLLRLKGFKRFPGLLGQNHQVLLLVGNSSFGGMTVDGFVRLNGFDLTKILEILQELQQPRFTYPGNGRISEQRWYSLKEMVWRELKLRDQSTPESEIHPRNLKEGYNGRQY